MHSPVPSPSVLFVQTALAQQCYCTDPALPMSDCVYVRYAQSLPHVVAFLIIIVVIILRNLIQVTSLHF